MNIKEGKNKKRVNFKLFETEFTKESAYILGILWADGHIREKSRLTSINCVESDINDILPVFLETGDWIISGKIKKMHKDKVVKTQKKLSTTTWGLFDILKRHGYLEKSHSAPNGIICEIPHELRKYWFRGFLDGDGCIKLGRKYGVEVVFTGPYNQDWSFMKLLCFELGVDFSIDNRLVKKGGYSHFRINKKQHVKIICDYIYSDFDNIGFTRKYKKYNDVINYIESKANKFWSVQDESFLISQYNKIGGVECAKMLNKKLESVYNKIRLLKNKKKI